MRRSLPAATGLALAVAALSVHTPVPATGAAVSTTSTTLVLSAQTSGYGQTVRASAAVASSDGPAQGDVVFTVDGAAIKANLTGGGTATILLPASAVGEHSVVATFVPQFPLQQQGSASPAQPWRVEPATVDLGVRVRGARPRTVAMAHLDLRGNFGTSPTGSVRLRLFRGAPPPRRTRSATLDDAARATVRLGRLDPGRYRLVATYGGDQGHTSARRTIRFRVPRP